MKLKCLLCGRDKFTHKSPHKCVGGFRKRGFNKLTDDEIYRSYKHGELDKIDCSIERLYLALKANDLNAYLVTDSNGIKHVFNYVPEINEFELVA